MSLILGETLGTDRFCSSCMSLQHVEFRNQQDLDHILTWQPPEVSSLTYPPGLLVPLPHLRTGWLSVGWFES